MEEDVIQTGALTPQVAPVSSPTEVSQTAATLLRVPSATAASRGLTIATSTAAVGSRKRQYPDAAAAAVLASAAVAKPPDAATRAKARRVAAALPAVDAAFFRAREAADAGSGSELSPASQQAAASGSLQVRSSHLTNLSVVSAIHPFPHTCTDSSVVALSATVMDHDRI